LEERKPEQGKAQVKKTQIKDDILFGKIQEQGKCTVQDARQNIIKGKVWLSQFNWKKKKENNRARRKQRKRFDVYSLEGHEEGKCTIQRDSRQQECNFQMDSEGYKTKKI